jgi:hypothetical protein
MDNNMAHEAHVELRVAMEHAIYLHWVVERGEAGADAMVANQSASVGKSIRTARQADVALPPEVEKEIEKIDESVDENKALQQFRAICEEIDSLGLYFMYGSVSGYVHPSLLIINSYASDHGTLTTEPQRVPTRSTLLMLAQCLVWARRDLGRVAPCRPESEGLDAISELIDARPLPPYHPITKAPGKGRRRARSKQRARSPEHNQRPSPDTPPTQ